MQSNDFKLAEKENSLQPNLKRFVNLCNCLFYNCFVLRELFLYLIVMVLSASIVLSDPNFRALSMQSSDVTFILQASGDVTTRPEIVCSFHILRASHIIQDHYYIGLVVTYTLFCSFTLIMTFIAFLMTLSLQKFIKIHQVIGKFRRLERGLTILRPEVCST